MKEKNGAVDEKNNGIQAILRQGAFIGSERNAHWEILREGCLEVLICVAQYSLEPQNGWRSFCYFLKLSPKKVASKGDTPFSTLLTLMGSLRLMGIHHFRRGTHRLFGQLFSEMPWLGDIRKPKYLSCHPRIRNLILIGASWKTMLHK